MADVLTAKVRCPHCQSLLNVFETSSGAQTIAVAVLGDSVQDTAKGLELFRSADSGPNILCPACEVAIDPNAPYRASLEKRRRV